MRSTTVVGAGLAAALVFAGLVACASDPAESAPASVWVSSTDLSADTDALPVSIMEASFVVDMGDKPSVVGLVDYVFAAKVISRDGVIYRDVTTVRTENGVKQVGEPYTQYTVEVIDNIKGTLKKNQPMPILKEGGVAMDGASVYLFEGDQLPKADSYFIFLGLAQPDGSITISGPNTTVTLNATSKHAIVSSDAYKQYAQAMRNEIPFKRDRSTSKYEEQ